MAQAHFTPRLYENDETKGIISTSHLNLDVEVPNEFKIWLKTNKTNLSSRGVSF
jgi:hypothetical protein